MVDPSFRVVTQCAKTKARAGVLKTSRGEVLTPIFMPVATQGSVKALDQDDLETLGVKAILANSYHLYLRPGTQEISSAGGLHRYMTYKGMILTDSGGYQVMSLSRLRTIEDGGVTFQSHIDGSRHHLTPEKVIEIQAQLGSDCWTTLDECPPFPATESQAKTALERTQLWAKDSLEALSRFRGQGANPLFFPILQGSFYPDLRRRAVEGLAELPAQGIAFGGFSVGEPKELTWETLETTTALCPPDKPRYLMGVGTPGDLWEAFSRGVDMVDCVYPTRVARTGHVMTMTGHYNISNASARGNAEPLDPTCACFVCRRYSQGYLRHLFMAKEISVMRLLSFHNIALMLRLSGDIRDAIISGRFEQAHKAFLDGKAAKMA